jgi:uncharacterized repeat protein (TIGR02543 family)
LSSKRKCRFIYIAFVFCLSAVIHSQAQTLTTLAAFNGANGSTPYAGLVQGTDGNFYGTTDLGGANNEGTVFKITSTGTLTTLYSFCAQDGCTDGENPYAAVVQGTDRNFYGTTFNGGFNGTGTVFKISPTGTLTTLWDFCSQNDCTDGGGPQAGLVQGTDGNLYGTTSTDGNYGYGTVFKITPSGALTTLYSFCTQSDCTDGATPVAGLVQGTDGNFYGTTSSGGAKNEGTVFKITPEGTLNTLYSFTGGTDGATPVAGLVQGTDGNFYGTTFSGGVGSGTVFKITPEGTLNTLYSFGGGRDGWGPDGGLVQATDGNFYGTTSSGGTTNEGTVFRITPAGTLTTLNSFDGADGAEPQGVLVQATDGNFYGTTVIGGTNHDGTVFRLSATNYTLTAFISGNGMVTSTDGFISCPGMCSHLYPVNTQVTLNAAPASGLTFTGWSGACTGTGSCNVTVTQNLSVTATFSQLNYVLTVSTNGSGSVTSKDSDINCPGVCGYSYSDGTQVTLNATQATGWSFTGWSGACSGTGSCNVTMTQDLSVAATFTQNQGFYSLTVSTGGAGTVTSKDGFIICPGTCSHTYQANSQVTLNATPTPGGIFSGWSGACSGTGSCMVIMTQNLSVTAIFSGIQEIAVHSFGNGNDGQNPLGNLIFDSAGNLDGTTSMGGMYGKGTVFEMSPNGTDTILHSFGSGNDGQNPFGNVIFDSAGNLYGTTSAGGMYGKGTVFELSPNGPETVLYNFGSGADGQNPYGGLIFDTAGNLYGTTVNGGTYGHGTAFELSPNGAGGWTETVAYNFGNGMDGQNPYAGLVLDTVGNLYGTTRNGGLYSKGMVFELSPNGIGCCRESPLYSFGNGAGDGQSPYAGLIFDTFGNLYGTTYGGGTYSYGTAFELSPNGTGGWTETVAYSFGSGTDGQNPSAGLIFDTVGNLYGTTQNGGLYSEGMAFELSPNGIGCCRESPLYSFGNGTGDGQHPYAGLIFNTGNLYGTTQNGGVYGGGTVFEIMLPLSPVQFVPATPCRVVDTRNPAGTYGGPPISGGTMRSFPLAQSGNPCNIPSNAIAYSLNVTVVPDGTLGYLTIWPTGESQPVVSTLNSADGRVKANAAIVPAGMPSGAVSVYVTNTTNVILDIDGYFTAPASGTYQFYTLPPCRIVDTRNNQDGGTLQAGVERDYLIAGTCGIPSNATAYSFNVTVLPAAGGLDYLTVWPQGESQPVVSTLNDNTGTVVANAAIVPAGSNNSTAFYAHSNSTNLLVDVNGYFAAPGTGGLSLYSVAPCRVYDSRSNGGQPFQGERTVNVLGSACAPPSSAQAYVFNATVVPPGSMPYLSLWPDGQLQPVVSTLNAYDGFTTSNMAIVPTTNGSIDAWAEGLTQLIFDISGYFAP